MIGKEWRSNHSPLFTIYKRRNKMITNKDIYRCYSTNLMQFMATNGIRYFLVAKDIKSNKVFYTFEKTEKFLQLLQQWVDNNPKYKI